MLGACVLGGICWGVQLVATRGFGFKLLGVLLLLLGIELRPRVARLDRSLGLTDRAHAPVLFAVVDEVAAAIGAPRIELVVLDESNNAWCSRLGVRQRPVLGLGLPLWGSLSPQARVALLAHELGHLVNKDPMHGLLSGSAVTTFYRLADLARPDGLYVINRARYWWPEALGRVFSYLQLSPISLVCRWIAHLLGVAAARDHRRAEFYADALAIAAGGTAGAGEALTKALFGADRRAAS